MLGSASVGEYVVKLTRLEGQELRGTKPYDGWLSGLLHPGAE